MRSSTTRHPPTLKLFSTTTARSSPLLLQQQQRRKQQQQQPHLVFCPSSTTLSALSTITPSSSSTPFHPTSKLLQRHQNTFDDEEASMMMDDDTAAPPSSNFNPNNDNNNDLDDFSSPPLDIPEDDVDLPNSNTNNNAFQGNSSQQQVSQSGFDETDDIMPPSAASSSSSAAATTASSSTQTSVYQHQSSLSPHIEQRRTERENKIPRAQRQPQQRLQQQHQRKPRRNLDDDEVTTEALDLVSSLGATTSSGSAKQKVSEEPPSAQQRFQSSTVTTTSLFGAATQTQTSHEDSSPSSSNLEDATEDSLSPESKSAEKQKQKQIIGNRARHVGNILKSHLSSVVPGPTNDQLESLLSECKDGRQLNKIIDELILPHPLMHDMLNGHGFRVFVFTKVAVAGLRLSQAAPWLRLMRYVRTRGFKLTRTYVTYCLDALRKETSQRFNNEGRNPHIAVDILSNTRYLLLMAAEDGVYCDWVLMTKTLFVITAVVAIFDRQNLYRSNWPVSGEVPRREGIVSEWVVSHERPADYDRVVQLADKLIDQLTQDVRERFRSRPPFSFMQRIADYYFATDNLDRMICVLEEALEMGVPIGESSTAKLMQLACAFNHPKVPELFMKFRVSLPQCMLAAPDFSRLLFWYSRSGGGLVCPQCQEPFNHRNVGFDVWSKTPKDQKECVLLQKARNQKGEFENNRRVPQCQDWSEHAMKLFELAQSRAISWTSIEWRGFILCHMFAPTSRALNALELLQDNLQRRAWDDFLAQQVIRLLRYHDPRRIIPTIEYWQGMGLHISPLVVQEAAIGVMTLKNDKHYNNSDSNSNNSALEDRIAGMTMLTKIARGAEIYTMAYTERVLLQLLQAAVDRGDSSDAETAIVSDFCSISPRALREDDRKDSCCDIKPAMNKKSSVFADAERYFPGANVFDF